MTLGGVAALKDSVPVEQLGFLPPDARDRLDALSTEDPALREVLDLVYRNVEVDARLWEVMAGVRHRVYELFGQSDGINRMAQGALEHRSPGSTDHSELLLERTVICLRALALFALSKREEVLGFTLSRFLRFDEETVRSTIERYFQFPSEECHEILPRQSILNATPLHHLLHILAYFEEHQPNHPIRHIVVEHLIRHLISDDPRFIHTYRQFLTLQDFLDMIRDMPDALSAGKIGNKVGNFFGSYAALRTPTLDFDKEFLTQHPDLTEEDLSSISRPRDTAIIGSMTFDALLGYEGNPCTNGNGVGVATASILKGYYLAGLSVPEGLHESVEAAILQAEFPEHIERQLKLLLRSVRSRQEANGGLRRPFFVRSTSHLEDGEEASFSGIYTSVLVNNNGDFESVWPEFKRAIFTVYASVFSRNALEYRKECLLDADEEMGLWIQDAHGAQHGELWYPDGAGVVLSVMPQSFGRDPRGGAVRLCGGFGETVVKDGGGYFIPFQDSYRPINQGPQGTICVLNRTTGEFESRTFLNLYRDSELCSSAFHSMFSYFRDDFGRDRCEADFAGIRQRSKLLPLLEYILRKLEKLLGRFIDFEFTVQWNSGKKCFDITLVQCRTQILPKSLRPSTMPKDVDSDRIIMSTKAGVNNITLKNQGHIIYIDSRIFSQCTAQNIKRYIGKIIAKITALLLEKDFIIIAPGAWGSTNEGDGIYVQPRQYQTASGIVEICSSGSTQRPSFGQHAANVTLEKGIGFANCDVSDLDEERLRAAPYASSLPSIEKLSTDVPLQFLSSIASCIRVINVREWTLDLFGQEMVAHLAQNSLGDRENGGCEGAFYFAPEGCDLPVPCPGFERGL